jgi:glycosyltransferase involved in cell wall biosynthesis
MRAVRAWRGARACLLEKDRLMPEPKFSVVIPTRERAGTLRYALRTCLEQDYDDYEIIVCDNHGGPATRQVVDEAASPRVHYVRAPRPLAMSFNWELGVSEARGEYVTVLGDDDGLLPYALAELDRLLVRHPTRALRWSGVYYSWPSIALEGQGNYLRIPLGREVRTVEARSAIASAIAFRSCYSTLPMIYNSVIHRDLLGELRARTGRLFANHSPDVYSGFALAYLAGTYVSTDVPMAVAGQSGGSYGVANLFLRGKSPLDHEFRLFNRQDGLPAHPWVPDLPIFPFVPVADSFQVAKEALFPDDNGLRLDRRALAAHCFHAIHGIETEDDWQAALGVIRATLSDEPESQAWFDWKFGNEPIYRPPPVQLRSAQMGFDGDFLHLSADAFGVADVHAAARLCAGLLGYEGRPLPYGQPGQSRLRAELASARAEAESLRGELARVSEGVALSRAEQERRRAWLPYRVVERAYALWRGQEVPA